MTSTPGKRTDGSAAAPHRDEPLDMVKGMLVIGMMIIHTSNLFVTTPALRYFVYPVALGFVSGSWVFISGFLISSHYQSSFDDDVGGTSRRLMARGLRLLLIFLLVNLVLGKLSLACSGGPLAGNCQLWNLVVLGDNAGMTFEILQGIAYVLLVAPLYMSTSRVGTVGIAALVIGATAAQFLGYTLRGLSWMILVGMAGIVMGWNMPAAGLREVVAQPRKRIVAAGCALLGWALYESSIFLRGTREMIVGAYIVGVGSVLLLLYVANGWIYWRGLMRHWMNLMARYALFCYMGQMVILWTWRYVAGDVPVLNTFAASFVIGLALLLAMVEVLDRARRRSPLVDRGYQMVLG